MSSNGYITARAYMSYAQIPLEDVAVVVTAQDGTAIAMRLTNRSGLIEPIPIPTPDREESERPEGNGQQPFTDVTVYAFKTDFEQIAVRITTVQNLEMVPLSDIPDRWDEKILFNTPPQNL